ncbi:FAD/NAD(P)-binding protein [Streptomyces sp. SAJ15]|uniref:FAD/NAD(P)-binding protein n=1 Tax=Streptomyces sp. SAJ15 TaxID=2011095 RepID=UPI001642E372|nr:FAD/NAD(P)-binding protein [Streptomyces sp. SAJ15]
MAEEPTGARPWLRRRAGIAVIGAGPRGTSLLERLVANIEECAPGIDLDIHVIDPWPPGGGQVWRREQPALLWSNTRADECTLFPDDASRCEGPVVTGPSLAAWARELTRGTLAQPAAFAPSDTTRIEASHMHDGWFATRSTVGDYLSWAFWRAVESAPPNTAVWVHPMRAVDVRESDEGGQRVVFDNGRAPLDVAVVLLAQGNTAVAPHPLERRLATHARTHRLHYTAAASTADVRLDGIEPGEPLIARGLGLAFVDVMVLLTSGRGGTFHRDEAGELRYAPSGREPVIFAGSRRGVPFDGKFRYTLPAGPPVLPRHFRAEAVAALGRGPVDFTRDLWPLISRELAEAGYRELARSHPERLAVGPRTFLARIDAFTGDGTRFAEWAADMVPSPEDRLDVDGWGRPLEGLHFAGPAALQSWMHAYLATHVERVRDQRHSAHLAVVHAVSSVVRILGTLLEDGRLSVGPGSEDLAAFLDFCRFRTSGPPSARLEQMLALARAGIVRFLGAGTHITAEGGVFRAGSPTVEGTVEARALIEARLPARSLSRVTDPLLSSLLRRREIGELVRADTPTGRRYPTGRLDVDPVDRRLRRADGSLDPHRFSVDSADFPRPGDGTDFFRGNDMVARTALRALRDRAVAAGPPGDCATATPITPTTIAGPPTDLAAARSAPPAAGSRRSGVGVDPGA